jgi:predicted GIY-YIG superfamily endonuclease
MWFCYFLKNPIDNRTYKGMTNNPKRRIRQHNQEITGGAKYTKRFGDKQWEIYAIIGGFPNKINALQAEWRFAHSNNKRRRSSKYSSPIGGIIGVNEVLKLDKWTNNSIESNADMELTMWIYEEYLHLLIDIPDNITVIPINNFNDIDIK